MRRIKQWDAEITADVLTNILQPGRFAQLDQNLTIRIRERQPGGVLAGIFVDDRRDPKERVTIIADHGTVLKNDNGSYLVLEDGNLRALRDRQARSGAGGVRPLCLRHVEILQPRPRRRAGNSRTLSLGVVFAVGRTIRSTSNCPGSFAPNCTTA